MGVSASSKGYVESCLPDAYVVPKHAEPFWLELKIGRIVKSTDLAYSVGVMQKVTMRRLGELGIGVGFLIGVKNTKAAFLVLPGENALNGRLNILSSEGRNSSIGLDTKNAFPEFAEFASKYLKRKKARV